MTATGQPSATRLFSRLDHLVVVADNLNQAAAWCEASLGVPAGPGGRHPLMGTHNLLLPIGGPAWPQAYLEMIAVDPAAAALPAGGRSRWFDMDNPALRAAVRVTPRLVHLVAQTASLALAREALAALGEDPGEPLFASRPGPRGELRWQISVRHDGVPQHGGALPALIEWDASHPSSDMPPAGLSLLGLRLASDDAPALQRALTAIGLVGVVAALPTTNRAGKHPAVGKPAIQARLATPKGEVVLRSLEY